MARAERLALGLSGGGDSLALLHALRAGFPAAELHALIVDHGLRAQSAQEAAFAQKAAEQAGAQASVLRWTTPRPGQGHARTARHQLLARACAERGIDLLCLAHTLDDRVETLRMRAARPGGDAQLTGPDRFDPAPVWPDGQGLVLARPFLTSRRAALRTYLKTLGVRWLDDPSNEDPAYERVRWRRDAWPAGAGEEVALLARSDAALRERATGRAAALDLIEAAARATPWGGYVLHKEAFERGDRSVSRLAVETLMLAVSGQSETPAPKQVDGLLRALRAGAAATAAGAALTPEGVLGRDPGGVMGRADGAPGRAVMQLEPGQCGVFDGRWRVAARSAVEIAPWGEATRSAKDVPAALRPGLAAIFDPKTGECLALPGLNASAAADIEALAPKRIAARLLPPAPPTWFDDERCVRNVEARLAKPGPKPNITV